MSNVKKLMMNAAGGDPVNVEQVFSTVVYDGAGSSGKTVTTGLDVANEGGIAWIKCRTQGNDPIIIDPQIYPNGDHWLYVGEIYKSQNMSNNVFSFSSMLSYRLLCLSLYKHMFFHFCLLYTSPSPRD